MATVRIKKMNLREKIFRSMFVVSIVFIMITVSFSWFMEGDNASVSNVHMDVEKGSDLLLKMGDATSGSKELTFSFAQGFTLDAVSGNGLHFYMPIIERDKDTGEKQFSGKYAKINDDYGSHGIYEIDFSMYIDKTMPVYLYSKSSDGVPCGVTPGIDEDGKEVFRKSPYGDFNTGNICGAIRIAILQADDKGTYAPTFIWAPNTNTMLYQKDNAWFVETDPKVKDFEYEDSYTYLAEYDEIKKEPKKKIITPSEEKLDPASGSYFDKETNILYAWGELGENLPIGNLQGGQDNAFRLVIWVDGNDRECQNALMGGLIFVSLHFGI